MIFLLQILQRLKRWGMLKCGRTKWDCCHDWEKLALDIYLFTYLQSQGTVTRTCVPCELLISGRWGVNDREPLTCCKNTCQHEVAIRKALLVNCDNDVTVTHADLNKAQIQETQHPNHSEDIKLWNPISHTCFFPIWNTISPTLLLLNQLQ